MRKTPAPVLHWPKLFEGQVGIHTNTRRASGNGYGTRDGWPSGLGDGNGMGNGRGNGYGSGWGFNE